MTLGTDSQFGPKRGRHGHTEEAPDFALEALFHKDNLEVFNDAALRAEARRIIRNNPNILNMFVGDKAAILAHWKGWEPFVTAFEDIIDRKKMPREILYEKYGRGAARETLVRKRKAENQLVSKENARFSDDMSVDERMDSLEKGTREMSREELQHKGFWFSDGKRLTRDYRRITTPRVETIDRLIDDIENTPDMATFFSRLAGVEYMAEEASRFWNESPEFLEQFGGKRPIWPDVHDPSQHPGRDPRTTHLGGDLDLARAYTPFNPDGSENIAYPQTKVLETLHYFEAATDDVHQTLRPYLENLNLN